MYCGKEKGAAGLIYCGARYYDPVLGRFITRDPIKGDKSNPQSLNRYTYCINNPLKFVDPFGLSATFADEEAQEAYEEETNGDTNEEGEEGQDATNVIDSDPNRLIIILKDGTIITLTEWVESGNIIVGFGYITENNGGIVELEHVLGIIVFDDEGGAKVDYWEKHEFDPNMNDHEKERIAKKMINLVGKENIGDLVKGINELREYASSKSSRHPLAALLFGAGTGAITGGKLGSSLGLP